MYGRIDTSSEKLPLSCEQDADDEEDSTGIRATAAPANRDRL